MTRPPIIERMAVRWHVARYENYIVQDHVALMEGDNAELRRVQAVLKSARLSASGRYVLRRVVASVVLAVLLGGVVVFGRGAVREVQHERTVGRVLRAQAASAPMSPELAAALEVKRERAARASALRHGTERASAGTDAGAAQR